MVLDGSAVSISAAKATVDIKDITISTDIKIEKIRFFIIISLQFI